MSAVLKNIPDGPAVICCNHSSFSDAIWVIVCSHRNRIFRTMAKKELFSHRVLGWFITKLGAFPVDREANDIHAVKTALGVLREGDKLLIFPEGTRVREGDVSHPHVGAVTFACRTDAPIVPVFLTRKKRFWAPLTLVFGEAYHPQFEGRRPSSDELEHLTQEMMDECLCTRRHAMSVRVAASAGFCFGVDRAVGLVEQTVREGKRAVTLGPIIHNHHVVQHFAALGVREIASPEEVPGEAPSSSAPTAAGSAVYDAAPGPRAGDHRMPLARQRHPHPPNRSSRPRQTGRQPLIVGTPEHPEVVAIAGWCRHPLVFPDGEALQKWLDDDPKRHDLPFTMVSQTTSTQFLWDSCKKIAKKVCTNLEFFDTICKATENRQAEAAALAAQCDAMIVVGDRKSSNTGRLAHICAARCPQVFLVDNASELDLPKLSAGRNHWHHSRSFDACVDNKGGQPHYERNQYYR